MTKTESASSYDWVRSIGSQSPHTETFLRVLHVQCLSENVGPPSEYLERRIA